MFDRIRALLARLHQMEEVQALSDRDLDDLGMTRDQVLDFLRMPTDITQRVTAMGAIFGVSEAELRRDHAQWVELLSTCGHCESRGACAKVLALADMADPASVDFCGNSPAFTDLAPHAT
jgi:Domain of unknown function (DUF1127)/Family of unknown function (DUF6455)